MLAITLFKQMARLIEIAKKFCCSKFKRGGGVRLLRTPLDPSLEKICKTFLKFNDS